MSREDEKRFLEIADQTAFLEAMIERTDERIRREQAKYNSYEQNAIRRKAAGNKPGALQSLKTRKIIKPQLDRLHEDKATYTSKKSDLEREELFLEIDLIAGIPTEKLEELKTTRDKRYTRKLKEFREKFQLEDEANALEAPPEYTAALAGIQSAIANAEAEAAAPNAALNRMVALSSRSLLGEPTAETNRALNELLARTQGAPGSGAGAGAAAAPSYLSSIPVKSSTPVVIGGTLRRHRRGGRSRKGRGKRNKTTRRLLRRR